MRACPSGSGELTLAIFALSCSIVLQVLARGLLDIFTNVNARCGLSAAIPHASILPNKAHCVRDRVESPERSEAE